MSENKLNLSANAIEIIDQELVKNNFVQTVMKMHKASEEDALARYEQEARYYKRIVNESEKLKNCTGISLISSFLEIAITGLSLQPGAKADCFLEPRSSKAGDKWVQTCTLRLSAYGELNLRIKAGQIIRANNPIVIYEGDHFQPYTTPDGRLSIDYKPAIPRESKTIIGCYVSLVLPHNGLDFKWLLMDDVERLANYSKPRFGTNPQANALYTSNNGQIDPGFLEAKTIKHAMRSYTRLKLSEYVSMEDDIYEEENEVQEVQAEEVHQEVQAQEPSAEKITVKTKKTLSFDDEDTPF